jgi:hypothetical protein
MFSFIDGVKYVVTFANRSRCAAKPTPRQPGKRSGTEAVLPRSSPGLRTGLKMS